MRGLTRVAAVALLCSASTLFAAPPSQVAWTPETLRLVASADPVNGKALSVPCAGCHGLEGISVNPVWPTLAGQGALYLYKQMQDYRLGARSHPIMSPLAAGLDDRAIVGLAAFYASLPLPKAQPSAEPLEAADILARRGDNRRMLPACDSCHRPEGDMISRDIAVLTAQNPEYFRLTMLEFKSGNRANDIYGRMRLIARQLSDEEIAQLARYYGARGAR
jgi:cytochrome c553